LLPFIDAEHVLDPAYARNLGVNVEELLLSQPDYGEQALEISEILLKSGSWYLYKNECIGQSRENARMFLM
jgi:recombination protein RecA